MIVEPLETRVTERKGLPPGRRAGFFLRISLFNSSSYPFSHGSLSLGRVAVIRVSDTGPGIPESVRDKVFQPFFSTKEEGTGLGLSIATRIIEDHGGRLELESRESEGATFIITLPLQESEYGQNPDR